MSEQEIKNLREQVAALEATIKSLREELDRGQKALQRLSQMYRKVDAEADQLGVQLKEANDKIAVYDKALSTIWTDAQEEEISKIAAKALGL